MAHYAQLTLAQRYQIQSLHQLKSKQKDIAQQIGVSSSTISRELARNRQANPDQPYQAQKAQQRSGAVRQRQPYKLTGALKENVLKRLRQRFSPEQISGVLALEEGKKVISHEAIYRYIYAEKATDKPLLTSYLRIRHKKRYKKRGQVQKRGAIPNRVGIEERPAIVEANTEIGHWEGDTVIGADHNGVLLTLVERVTKYTIIVKLPSKHALQLARQAVTVKPSLIYENVPCRSIPLPSIMVRNLQTICILARCSRLLFTSPDRIIPGSEVLMKIPTG